MTAAAPVNGGPEPCDLLVSGGIVLTLDAEDRRISAGAVAVRGDRIVAVGTGAELRARYAPARRIEAANHFILPGFVNAHNHTPIMLVRGMMEDIGVAASYSTAVPPIYALSAEEAYHLSRLGLYELMRFGSTTVVDSFHDGEPLARALVESGLRGIVGGRILDVDPAGLAAGGPLTFDRARGEKRLEASAALVRRWNGAGDGRVTTLLQPHATNTCSKALLTETRDTAKRLGVPIHIHVAQSQDEWDQVKTTHDRTPVELLDEVGLLEPTLVGAHGLFVTDSDVARYGRTGAALVHVPIGNAKSGFVARVLDFEKAGATLAIGSDTVSADVFESMRTAIALARIRGAGYDLKARHVLGWATHDAARALDLRDVGRLAPGMKADLITVDASGPNLAAVVDGVGILVYGARGSDVDTVVVDGRIVLEKGHPVSMNGAEVVQEARAVIARLWRRQGAAPLAMT